VSQCFYRGPQVSDASKPANISAVLRDESRPLGDRLAAAAALTRIGPTGDVVAADLRAALSTADRWLRIGLLRGLGQLGRGYPRRPEVSLVWPQWVSRLAVSHPPLTGESAAALLGTLVEHLDHDDYDVRRNAAFAIGLVGTDGRAVAAAVEKAPRLREGIRHDVLHRIRSIASPRGAHRFDHLDARVWPWDLEMTNPAVDLIAIGPSCERQWTTGGDYRIDVPKWQFLHYLVERHGVVLHGSRMAGLDVLTPRSRSWGGGRTAGQPGVFAVDHALMAMYFGIVDRSRVPNMSNGIGRSRHPTGGLQRTFRLGIEFASLAARPFTEATVYVLPAETFTMMGELTSLTPVRPLASLAVSPGDFPLLDRLWGSDIGPLSVQFGDRFPFLADVGCWPSKRLDSLPG